MYVGTEIVLMQSSEGGPIRQMTEVMCMCVQKQRHYALLALLMRGA